MKIDVWSSGQALGRGKPIMRGAAVVAWRDGWPSLVIDQDGKHRGVKPSNPYRETEAGRG